MTESFPMGEQLELDLEDVPACACGRPLVEHIEHYRKVCCMCILRSRIEWNENPVPKLEHLRRWLRARERKDVIRC